LEKEEKWLDFTTLAGTIKTTIIEDFKTLMETSSVLLLMLDDKIISRNKNDNDNEMKFIEYFISQHLKSWNFSIELKPEMNKSNG